MSATTRKTWTKDRDRMLKTLRKLSLEGKPIRVNSLSRFKNYSDNTKRTLIGNFTKGLYK